MDPSQLPEHLRPKRAMSAAVRKRGTLRDTDVGETVTRLRAFTWGSIGGLLGLLLGVFQAQQGGPGWLIAVLPIVGWAGLSGAVLLIVGSAGSAASRVLAPASGSTPRPKEYSQAESLAARGLYEEAVTAFELCVAEEPEEPGPYLRIARIYRDQLGRYEDAARWFRRAVREAVLPAGPSYLARRELVELYVHKMKTPEKALPDLARMSEELAGTPEGEWAAGEYRDIKARM